MATKLFNRNFTLLWLGQSVSQLGNGAGFIAVMWWIQTTTGSAMALGTLAMIQSLIGVGLGPFAGTLVDRANRKHIIVLSDLVRGLLSLLLAWLVFTDGLTLPALFLVKGITAVCAHFFYPAIGASIPLLVPDKELERANSLNQITINLVNIIGFGAGGILVALTGVPALLLINGLAFIVSAISEMFIHIPTVNKTKPVGGARAFLGEIVTGIQYIRGNQVLFKILQVAMILNFFFAPYFVLLPLFVSDHLGAGSDVYGYLLSAQMLGALTATLIISLSQVVKRNLWLVKWGLVIQAATMLVLPFLPRELWLIHTGLFAVGGLFNAFVNIFFGALVQRTSDPKHLGKVFGVMSTMTGGLQPLSQGLSGALADFIKVPVIYTVCSIANGASGVMFTQIRGIDRFLAGEKQPQEQPVAAKTATANA